MTHCLHGQTWQRGPAVRIATALYQSNANGNKEYENSKHTLDIFWKQSPKPHPSSVPASRILLNLSSSSHFQVSFLIRAAMLFEAKSLVTTPSQCIMGYGTPRPWLFFFFFFFFFCYGTAGPWLFFFFLLML